MAKARFDPGKCPKEIFAPAHFVNLVFKCIHLDELLNLVKDVPYFVYLKQAISGGTFLAQSPSVKD